MAEKGLIAQRVAPFVFVLALASCAESPPPFVPPPPPSAPVEPPPPPPPPPPEPPREADTCGRADYANLVGRNRSEIPVFPQPSRVRVACTTCPVTMDFNPQRLNILFDQTTGVIAEVRCG